MKVWELGFQSGLGRETAIAENGTRLVSSRRLARVSKRKTPITEEAQCKPTAELRREGRLARIAKALASGATVTDTRVSTYAEVSS